MFFIQNGDCVIQIRDHNNRVVNPPQLLISGTHFGEIGIIYKCKRKCTISSRNYSTLARLTKEQFRAIGSDYPRFTQLMRRFCRLYRDTNIDFIRQQLKQIEWV